MGSSQVITDPSWLSASPQSDVLIQIISSFDLSPAFILKFKLTLNNKKNVSWAKWMSVSNNYNLIVWFSVLTKMMAEAQSGSVGVPAAHRILFVKILDLPDIRVFQSSQATFLHEQSKAVFWIGRKVTEVFWFSWFSKGSNLPKLLQLSAFYFSFVFLRSIF